MNLFKLRAKSLSRVFAYVLQTCSIIWWSVSMPYATRWITVYLLLYITIGSRPRLTSLSFLIASTGVCISENVSRICSVSALSDISELAAEITSYTVPSAVSSSASLSDKPISLAAVLTCISHEMHQSLFVPS